MELNFNKIRLEDKNIFGNFLQKYPPQLSELTFTNLFSWRYSKNYAYAIFENHLLISYEEQEKKKFLQPVGEKPWLIIEKILALFPEASFERVENETAGKLTGYNVQEQREMFDYVYSIQDLIRLEGNKYEQKRNLISQCKRHSPSTCILDQKTLRSFFKLQEKWCNLRDCKQDNSARAEDIAVREALAHFKELALFGVCININGNIEAFAIGEKLNNDTFVEHFEKANTSFKGIYQHVINEFAKSIPKQFDFLNREQDLGMAGLRKNKLSYYPVKFIEKFKIEKK